MNLFVFNQDFRLLVKNKNFKEINDIINYLCTEQKNPSALAIVYTECQEIKHEVTEWKLLINTIKEQKNETK